MLGKLIKYEFKATRGLMLTMYAVLFVLAAALAIIVKITGVYNVDLTHAYGPLLIIQTWLMVAFFLVLMATIVGAIFSAVIRFRRNILGAEGYLMNTLPVSAGKNVLAKMIVSSVWTILGVFAVVIASVCLVLYTTDLLQMMNIDADSKPVSIDLEDVLALILTLLQMAKFYLSVYASLAVGYSLNKHHRIASIATYIGIAVVNNLLMAVSTAVLPYEWTMWEQIVRTALIGVGSYFLTVYFLEKRLNLE